MSLFVAEVNSLFSTFQTLEKASSTDQDVLLLTKEIIKKTYAISKDGISFHHRLESLGFDQSALTDRVVRQIGKIANYWRICQSLAEASRKFSRAFTNIQMRHLVPFRPDFWPTGSRNKLYVHAEIQIVIYYATHDTHPQPRIIGVSKEGCFLCNSFLRAYALFAISKTHGQLYSKWTVPDLAEYHPSIKRRLRSSLSAVYVDVKAVSSRSDSLGGSFVPFPNQSSINLLRPVYGVASLLTKSSRTGSISSFVIPARPLQEIAVVSSDDDVAGTQDDVVEQSESSSESSGSSTISLSQAQPDSRLSETTEVENSSSEESFLRERLPTDCESHVLNANDSARSEFDWVHLMFSFGTQSHTGSETSFQTISDSESLDRDGSYTKGHISVSDRMIDATIEPGIEEIDVSKILPGSSVTLERSMMDRALTFVLRKNAEKAVRIQCEWHK